MAQVLFEERSDRYLITLDSPPLNIIDISMMRELVAALDAVRPDRHMVLIGTSSERAFSAGVSVPEHEGAQVAAMLELFHQVIRRVRAVEIPTVALVQGMALGGGCELAMSCDFVIASDAARFAQPEIRLGVFPPVAAWQLQRQLPPRRGLEMLLTGEEIGPFEARDLGLINVVLEADDFDRQSEEWLARLLKLSASSLRITKKAWRAARDAGTFELALSEVEKIYLEELAPTADAAEGLRAFMEKREPEWRHR